MFCFSKLGSPISLKNLAVRNSLDRVDSRVVSSAVSTCKMAMYNQTYFRGKLVEISGSVNDFETINFDDSIASVKVEGNCCWKLFAEKYFQGASIILKTGDYKSSTNIVDVFKKASSAKNSC